MSAEAIWNKNESVEISTFEAALIAINLVLGEIVSAPGHIIGFSQQVCNTVNEQSYI